jgi:hypothetical protein
MKLIPTTVVGVTMVSITDEKTPMDTSMPSIVKIRKPTEANAIFISFIFFSDSNEMILMSVDKPRNENRRNISISFITQTLLFPNADSRISYFRCWSFHMKRKKGRRVG